MHSRNLIAPPLRIKDREGNLFPAGVAIKNELVQSEISPLRYSIGTGLPLLSTVQTVFPMQSLPEPDFQQAPAREFYLACLKEPPHRC